MRTIPMRQDVSREGRRVVGEMGMTARATAKGDVSRNSRQELLGRRRRATAGEGARTILTRISP